MDHQPVRRMIEDAAIKNNFSGSTKITMTREYEEFCFHHLSNFKDEIFENSDLSYYISKVLTHLPITHNREIYDLYTTKYPIDEEPGQYLWSVGDRVLSIEEINSEFSNDPLYDVDRQNVSDIGDPVFDTDLLTEFLGDSLYQLHNSLEWDVGQYDSQTGLATVTATILSTIDQIMNLPDYALTGWDYSMETLTRKITIEGY